MRKHLSYILFTKRAVLSLLLFFCCIISISAQDIQFERIPNDLGLSQNFISALIQDHKGFIWVGTKDGLNRFDGYSFKVFQNDPFDSTSISQNHINCIFEDSQNRLWIGTNNGLNLIDRKQENFRHLFPDPENQQMFTLSHSPPGLVRQHISSITEDKEGNIWIGTMRGVIYKLKIPEAINGLENIGTRTFIPGEKENELIPNPVKKIEIDALGKIWILTINEITCMERNTSSGEYEIRRLHWEEIDPEKEMKAHPEFFYLYGEETKIDHRFHAFIKDKKGRIWIKTVAGFAKWIPEEKRFSNQYLNFDLKKPFVFPLGGTGGKGFVDQKGRIWVTEIGALTVFDTLTQSMVGRYHRRNKPTMGLPKTGIRSILEDDNGNIWLGTNGMGLYKYNPNKQKFKNNARAKLREGESVRTIFQSKDGTIWLGTNNTNLQEIAPGSKESKPLILELKRWLRDLNTEFAEVQAMAEDSLGNLWIGTNHGLIKLKRRNGQTIDWDFYLMNDDPESKGAFNNIKDIHIDEDGELWILTNVEFGRFDTELKEFFARNYLEINGAKLLNSNYPCIFQQEHNKIFWLGTNEGLLRFDPIENRFKFFTSDPKNPKSLSQKLVNCIHPDPKVPDEVFWIGTGGGGLNRFDLKTETFTHFKKKDGLPDNVIYGMLSDEEGNLWLSTNQGLSKFNPQTKVFKNYSVETGLQDNEFNSGAYFKNEDGLLYFGGIRGFNVFDPSAIQEDSFKAPIVLTDLKIANESVNFKVEDTPLKQSISESEELVLSWKDNVFSFEFSSLDYTNSNENKYAYKLENFDDQWQNIRTQRSATFTNIDPGEYIFKVKGTNHDGHWNEEGASLKIKIIPPWWKTIWAYLAFACILTFLIFLFYRFNLNRQLEKAETLQLKEMDNLKTKLYANITHEFRTPLTVIMGMTDNIKGHEKEKKLIQRNSNDLMTLVNQMLDLSKAESGNMDVEWIQSDIISYLNYLKESFHSLAIEKKIQLNFESDLPELIMDYDEVKIQQIINNLLSNALKFTRPGGTVSLNVQRIKYLQQDFLNLEVIDNGVGIRSEHLPHVFDRFYQADNSSTRTGEGTGIGLALTKELLRLLDGEIEVHSQIEKGTRFTILLPITKKSSSLKKERMFQNLKPQVNNINTIENFNALVATSESDHNTQTDRSLLLIIEDNLDVIAYIQSILEKNYQIETANDGQAGIDKAVAIIPDVIISDVMMPIKDGYEVCQTLKTDERTSHIPIIMLTAKATQQDRLVGLKTGADAYLMKPFDKEELFIRLEKLIELRKILQVKYLLQTSPNENPVNKTPEPAIEPTLDDLFLQKIMEVIRTKMSDPTLGVSDLCDAVSLSHTQVFRKLKALTGESPTAIIRKTRLQKAKQLLEENHELNISEIAYSLGFNDPNYFSRAFNKEFGISPSVIRK